MHNKQVTATQANGSKYVWTDNSKQSLEEWKKKPCFKDCTFSELEDNPNLAKELRREAIKAALDSDDIIDIVLALAKDNPSAIPDSIKSKVQEALQA